jgi:hypothetical protein
VKLRQKIDSKVPELFLTRRGKRLQSYSLEEIIRSWKMQNI